MIATAHWAIPWAGLTVVIIGTIIASIADQRAHVRERKERRASERLRALADQAHAQGRKEMADDLHQTARREETRRRIYDQEKEVRP